VAGWLAIPALSIVIIMGVVWLTNNCGPYRYIGHRFITRITHQHVLVLDYGAFSRNTWLVRTDAGDIRTVYEVDLIPE
jgi:hypothetical protein